MAVMFDGHVNIQTTGGGIKIEAQYSVLGSEKGQIGLCVIYEHPLTREQRELQRYVPEFMFYERYLKKEIVFYVVEEVIKDVRNNLRPMKWTR